MFSNTFIESNRAPSWNDMPNLRRSARPVAGVAVDRDLLPDVRPPAGSGADGAVAYEALLARWRTQVAALAGEFIAGRALVDPTPDACTYCPHSLACRVARDPADRAEELAEGPTDPRAEDGEAEDG